MMCNLRFHPTPWNQNLPVVAEKHMTVPSAHICTALQGTPKLEVTVIAGKTLNVYTRDHLRAARTSGSTNMTQENCSHFELPIAQILVQRHSTMEKVSPFYNQGINRM